MIFESRDPSEMAPPFAVAAVVVVVIIVIVVDLC